ncbi:MAG: GGDEF domain-containing protein [Oceanospirillales bacterium]|nr:GGDEF domain-containing protein [Oceanospirillales bacterium]
MKRMRARPKSFRRTLTALIWLAAVVPALLLSGSHLVSRYKASELRIQQEQEYALRRGMFEFRRELHSYTDEMHRIAADGSVIKSVRLDLLNDRTSNLLQEYLDTHPHALATMVIDKASFVSEARPISSLKMNLAPFFGLIQSLIHSTSTVNRAGVYYQAVQYQDILPEAARRDDRTLLGVMRPIIKSSDSLVSPFEVVGIFLVIHDVDALVSHSLILDSPDMPVSQLNLFLDGTLIYRANGPLVPIADHLFDESMELGASRNDLSFVVGKTQREVVSMLGVIGAEFNTLLLMLTGMLCVYFVATWLTRRLVAPIERLRDMTLALKRWDPEHERPRFNKVQDYHEFSELSELLDDMSEQLQQKFINVNETNDTLRATAQALQESLSRSSDQIDVFNALTMFSLHLQHKINLDEIGQVTVYTLGRLLNARVGLIVNRSDQLPELSLLSDAPEGFVELWRKQKAPVLNEQGIQQWCFGVKGHTLFPIYLKSRCSGFIVHDHLDLDDFKSHALTLFAAVLQATLEQAMLTLELEKLANNDALTGLYNRHYFDARLRSLQEKYRTGNGSGHLGIMTIDVNGLKYVNDHIGHAAGDQLLREVANILESLMRKSDCLCRTGGDEFVALLENVDSAQCEQLMHRATREAATHRLTIEGQIIDISFSIGFACSDRDPVDRITTLADRRMYTQKQQHYGDTA